MYSIFTYIWLICGVNVGKYSIHGAYGYSTWRCSIGLLEGNPPFGESNGKNMLANPRRTVSSANQIVGFPIAKSFIYRKSFIQIFGPISCDQRWHIFSAKCQPGILLKPWKWSVRDCPGDSEIDIADDGLPEMASLLGCRQTSRTFDPLKIQDSDIADLVWWFLKNVKTNVNISKVMMFHNYPKNIVT